MLQILRAGPIVRCAHVSRFIWPATGKCPFLQVRGALHERQLVPRQVVHIARISGPHPITDCRRHVELSHVFLIAFLGLKVLVTRLWSGQIPELPARFVQIIKGLRGIEWAVLGLDA